MTKGLIVDLKDIEKTKTTVQLFNGQKWEVRERRAFRFTTLYEKGKPTRIYFLESETKKIFSSIKIVFDIKGQIVAQRVQSKTRLLTTKENLLFVIKNKNNTDNAIEIYALIMAIEEQEYIDSIRKYWYEDRITG